jgi:acyl-CoA reductase-like NAD-dependent aldehyde dehydrogenase
MTLPADSDIDEALAAARIAVPKDARASVREAIRALARLAEKIRADL